MKIISTFLLCAAVIVFVTPVLGNTEASSFDSLSTPDYAHTSNTVTVDVTFSCSAAAPQASDFSAEDTGTKISGITLEKQCHANVGSPDWFFCTYDPDKSYSAQGRALLEKPKRRMPLEGRGTDPLDSIPDTPTKQIDSDYYCSYSIEYALPEKPTAEYRYLHITSTYGAGTKSYRVRLANQKKPHYKEIPITGAVLRDSPQGGILHRYPEMEKHTFLVIDTSNGNDIASQRWQFIAEKGAETERFGWVFMPNIEARNRLTTLTGATPKHTQKTFDFQNQELLKLALLYFIYKDHPVELDNQLKNIDQEKLGRTTDIYDLVKKNTTSIKKSTSGTSVPPEMVVSHMFWELDHMSWNDILITKNSSVGIGQIKMETAFNELKNWNIGGYKPEIECVDNYQRLDVMRKDDFLCTDELFQSLVSDSFNIAIMTNIFNRLYTFRYITNKSTIPLNYPTALYSYSILTTQYGGTGQGSTNPDDVAVSALGQNGMASHGEGVMYMKYYKTLFK